MLTFIGNTKIIPSLRSFSIPFLLSNRVSNNFLPQPHQAPKQQLYHYSSVQVSPLQSNNNIISRKMSNQPSPPFEYYSSSSINSLDLTQLDETISVAEAKRQEAFDISAKIKILITKIRRSLEQEVKEGSDNSETSKINDELEALIAANLPSEKNAVRLANIQFQFIDYARLKAYQYFLSHGKLIPPSELPPNLSDEEYLAGAVIGLTRDLARYVIGRATARDAKSVIIARNLTSQCLLYLMKFDFRNGMLRRKYDGVKYQLKTCETVLYELSVTGLEVNEMDETSDSEPKTKRAKIDGNSEDTSEVGDLMPNSEIEELRLRMVHRDDLREKLIKRCRDAQKAAKQAIYALHRGTDIKRATHLISECEKIVKNDLYPMVDEDPTLHYGSYANVLEEYAEAKLFHVWLMGEGDGEKRGRLLTPDDFTTIPLEPGEYLGGLCDLTGEVGRSAVQMGTKRDSNGVQFCLETNLSILFSLETLQRFPSGSYIHKKMDTLRQSVEKLERMLYELSLVKATGREIKVDSVNEASMGKDNNNDKDN
jgi:predicted translin family RNA/ssDNA-binding protein